MEQIFELRFKELFDDIEQFTEKKVSVEGIVDHVCPSKTKLALVSDDGQYSIEVTSDKELPSNYEAKRVLVSGKLTEVIVDEEFLQKKKQEIDSLPESDLKTHALENYEKLKRKVETSQKPVKKYYITAEQIRIIGCE